MGRSVRFPKEPHLNLLNRFADDESGATAIEWIIDPVRD